jgi:uncharacterized repeat protein (TIGR02543 family)
MEVLPIPSLEGYTFSYWFFDEAGLEIILPDEVFTENTTIYAGYDQTINMTFDFDGGNYIDLPEVTQYYGLFVVGNTFQSVNLVTIPETLIEKTGFTFEGWYYDVLLTNPVTAEDEITIDLADATIYAKWTEDGI